MPPQIFLPLLSRVKTHIETSQNTTYESSCTLSRNCLVNSWRLFVSYKTSLFFSCLSDKYALLKRIKLFFKSNNSIYIYINQHSFSLFSFYAYIVMWTAIIEFSPTRVIVKLYPYLNHHVTSLTCIDLICNYDNVVQLILSNY